MAIWIMGVQVPGPVSLVAELRGRASEDARAGWTRRPPRGGCVQVTRAAEPVAQQAADVDGADGGNGLDAVVGRGGVRRMAPAGADAQRADAAAPIDLLTRGQVADGAGYVLGASEGILQEARLPSALALKGRVESEGGEAEGGRPWRTETSRLLLHAAPCVGDHDSGQAGM
jgi:hypothetical protein